ncbi:MAG TPA: FmdB family zinc ribbon protein [Solirubrobacteraceae bacterium]|jgi:putative FmdB family regulatory protein|nr:FmdB family zinc ribbon protein [Solirubrobacteraceae bacterium]
MPIYEYKCENGHIFDAMQRMSEDPLSTCQECEAPVKRVFHPVAVHFKGSGFYNTDYGTRKRSREAKENAGSSEGGEKTSDAKTSDSGSEPKTSEPRTSESKTSESKKTGSSTASASSASSSSG